MKTPSLFYRLFAESPKHLSFRAFVPAWYQSRDPFAWTFALKLANYNFTSYLSRVFFRDETFSPSLALSSGVLSALWADGSSRVRERRCGSVREFPTQFPRKVFGNRRQSVRTRRAGSRSILVGHDMSPRRKYSGRIESNDVAREGRHWPPRCPDLLSLFSAFFPIKAVKAT